MLRSTYGLWALSAPKHDDPFIPKLWDQSINKVPKGFREITQEEFAKSSFFRDKLRYTAQKQITDWTDPKTGKTPRVHVRLFYMWNDIGYGIQTCNGSVRYYAFGCDHSYSELTYETCREEGIPHYGRCWHVQRCTKCGHVSSYDSGD